MANKNRRSQTLPFRKGIDDQIKTEPLPLAQDGDGQVENLPYHKDIEDSVDPQALEAIKQYGRKYEQEVEGDVQPDLTPEADTHKYDPYEFDKKLQTLKEQQAKERPSRFRTPLPQKRPGDAKENGRQDLERLMADYEDAVHRSSQRANETSGFVERIALRNPAAAQIMAKGNRDYIDEPVRSIAEPLEAGQSGANLNKSVSAQFAVDEDNDAASDSSRLARSIAKKYGILDAENETATAAQIKRVAPFVTTEMKGQQKQQVTETKEDASTERNKQNIQSKENIAGQNNETKLKVARILAQAGIDRTEIAGILGLEKSIVDSAIDQNIKTGGAGGGGSAADMSRRDRSVIGNPFPTGADDDVYTVKPGHPVPDQATSRKVTEAARWAKVVDLFADKLMKAKSSMTEGDLEDAFQQFATLKSTFNMTNQALVKNWQNGVANGKDIENAISQVGDYDGFLSFITGFDVAKTRALKQSNREVFDSFMSIDFVKTKADPSKLSPTTGGTGGAGGSASGPVFDPSGAANTILEKRGLPKLDKNNATPPSAGVPPVKDNTPKPRRWNPQTKKFEVVQ